MARKVSKVYIDSKLKTSGTDNDFIVDLPESLELSSDARCVITDVTVARSWFIVNPTSDCLYVRQNAGGTVTDAIVKIPNKNYNINTLADAIKLALNNKFGGNYQATADDDTAKITITRSGGATFKVFTDEELKTVTWAGDSFNSIYPNSINTVIGNTNLTSPDLAASWTSPNICDLLGYHSLYITSNTLSNYSSMDLRGGRSICKKIIADAQFLDLIVDRTILYEDSIDVSGISLKRIDFQIRDSRGNIVPLQSPVSFSLLFLYQD